MQYIWVAFCPFSYTTLISSYNLSEEFWSNNLITVCLIILSASSVCSATQS